jgi:hypothetical protein
MKEVKNRDKKTLSHEHVAFRSVLLCADLFPIFCADIVAPLDELPLRRILV